MLEGLLVFGVLTFVPSLLHERLGIPLSQAGAVVAAYGLGGLAYSRAAPYLLRRLPPRRVARAGALLVGLGFVLIAYTLLTLAGMARYGKERWRRDGEVFSVWFGLLGRLAPYGLVGRPEDGRFRRRGFGSALSRTPWTSSLLAVVAIATGAAWTLAVTQKPQRPRSPR